MQIITPLVGVFTLAIVLVLLLILISIPAKKNQRNAFIFVLLIALVIQLVAEFLLHLGSIDIRGFSIVVVSMVCLYGPTLFFYVRTFYGLNTSSYVLHVLLTQTLLTSMWLAHIFTDWILPQWLLSSYYSVLLLVYFVFTLKIRVKAPLKKHEAWMSTIAIGFGILVIMHLIEVVLINLNRKIAIEIAVICTSSQNMFTALFLMVVIRQIVVKPDTFSEVKMHIPYKHENIQFDKSQLTAIVNYVANAQAYKNSYLNRETVSTFTGIREEKVSEIVNGVFKKNFNDWINDYRIEEAQDLLLHSDLSIKEICFEVGFNSKSAFNTAFKKRLKLTPSEFRNQS